MRRSVLGEAEHEDVEEEDVGFMEGEDEVASVRDGAEVGETLGEFCE